ncbi:MAG: homoserine kinase [Caldilineaceae bacterium]
MKFVASIPATSANLGPGFDSVGLALNLWNHFEFHLQPDHLPISVETNGEGNKTLPTDQSHLSVQVLLNEIERLALIHQLDLDLPSFHLVCRNNVPAGSGLGSSSTAVLGGLMLAHAYVQLATHHPFAFERDQILSEAAAEEGHGDNVAPAMLGGLVIVATDETGLIAQKVTLPPLRVVVCVPEFHFLTSQARAVLPEQLRRADAIANIGRTALVVEALRNQDYNLLARAMADRIHEPYRLPIIPGALAARQAALCAGAAAVSLSGAGPGMIAFSANHHEQIGQAMVNAFAVAGLASRFWTLDTLDDGATLTSLA